MLHKRNIIFAVKKLVLVDVVCTIIQLLFLIGVNVFNGSFADNLSADKEVFLTFLHIFNVILIFAIVFVNFNFAIKIIKTYSLSKIQPVKCVVSDILSIKYKKGNKYRCCVALLLKDECGYLLTYGKYNLSYYRYIIKKVNNVVFGFDVYRSDGSALELGDTVYAYVRKRIAAEVYIGDDITVLNNKKVIVASIKGEFDARVLKMTKFYEGNTEIENI